MARIAWQVRGERGEGGAEERTCEESCKKTASGLGQHEGLAFLNGEFPFSPRIF